MNIALTMMPVGIWQMMRGLIVPICAFFSICFLKKKLYRHHWTAICLIVFGVFFVGTVGVMYSKKHDTDEGGQGSVGTGVILVVISQCFTGVQFITEEKILADYYLDPFQIVGTEGMWGLAVYMLLLPLMQYIRCGYPGGSGLASLCDYGNLENSAFAYYQIGINKGIIGFYIGYMISIAAFNSFGIATTKYASAAQRSTVDSCRQLTVWAMSIILFGDPVEPLCLVGFAILVFGTLLYNEIIELPCLGFNQNTKRAIAAREGGSGKANDFMMSSPAAAYDAKRNTRNM